MPYFAHTADGPDGKPADTEHWQSLKDHLRNVATRARQFARPLDLEPEAELAGLLHDLGKYAARFQARLQNPSAIHGVNHWAAGAAKAMEEKLYSIAFAVDGHHTGLPALRGGGFRRQCQDLERAGFTIPGAKRKPQAPLVPDRTRPK